MRSAVVASSTFSRVGSTSTGMLNVAAIHGVPTMRVGTQELDLLDRQLSPEQASRWLGVPVARPMTLAELLEKRGDITRLAGGNSERRATTGQYL